MDFFFINHYDEANTDVFFSTMRVLNHTEVEARYISIALSPYLIILMQIIAE